MPENKVSVRVESCLMAEDGSHVLVNATLPDGARVVNVQLPIPASAEALALALINHQGVRYRLANIYTGNISVDAPAAESVAEPAAESVVQEAIPTSDASAVDAAVESEVTPVGVADGAKSKTK